MKEVWLKKTEKCVRICKTNPILDERILRNRDWAGLAVVNATNQQLATGMTRYHVNSINSSKIYRFNTC